MPLKTLNPSKRIAINKNSKIKSKKNSGGACIFYAYHRRKWEVPVV